MKTARIDLTIPFQAEIVPIGSSIQRTRNGPVHEELEKFQQAY